MTRTLTQEGRLAAPVDRVLALLTDPAFLEIGRAHV